MAVRPDKLDILRLGSRTKPFVKLGISQEANLLNTAFKQKLPVPTGLFLLDGAWQRNLEDGVTSYDGTNFHVHDADFFLERFALHKLRQTIWIRPIFCLRDDPTHTLPLPEHLFRPKQATLDPLIELLIDIWTAPPASPPLRRDIQIMLAFPVTQQGTAITRADADSDLILHGDAALSVAKLRGLTQPTAVSDTHQRVQRLLQGVRRALSLEGADWEIEWRDDGARCWLTAIRPKPTS